ncbi:MAG: hypothetical protein KIT84_31235 [Labilithrix sp.]|nr:hypothetical protein [Labilithrix sp.]
MALGVVGLVAFPLTGAALVARLVEPLVFVALSMLALVLFGGATLALHGQDHDRGPDDFLTRH